MEMQAAWLAVNQGLGKLLTAKLSERPLNNRKKILLVCNRCCFSFFIHGGEKKSLKEEQTELTREVCVSTACWRRKYKVREKSWLPISARISPTGSSLAGIFLTTKEV